MGLSRGPRPLFSPRWVAGLAPVAEAAQSAKVKVYTPGSRTYDPDTDSWTITETVHYEGSARVQPIRSSSEVRNTGDSTTLQRVRVQIPTGSIPILRPDMRLRVTECLLNPSLLTYQFIVVEPVDSSNPVEQTFECTVNNETVV